MISDMTKPLLILNVVGLTHEMLGPNTPHLSRLTESGFARPMGTVLPAVTCSAQSTILTGTLPRDHGAVGNGWYFRDLAEVWLWRQSNHLVAGERIYDVGKQRDPSYTTAKMFLIRCESSRASRSRESDTLWRSSISTAAPNQVWGSSSPTTKGQARRIIQR